MTTTVDKSGMWLTFDYVSGHYLFHWQPYLYDHHDALIVSWFVDNGVWETYDVSHWTMEDEEDWCNMTDGHKLAILECLDPLPMRTYEVRLHAGWFTITHNVRTTENGPGAAEWCLKYHEQFSNIRAEHWRDYDWSLVSE